MINSFIIGLMRLIGGSMFFSGMGMLLYAVVGGYYHYSPLWHAIAWGVAGWFLFFIGKDLLEQYKPTEQPALPYQPERPMPLPISPYPNAGNASASAFNQRFGGQRPSLDSQSLDD